MMYRLDQIQGTNYCLLVAKRYINVAATTLETSLEIDKMQI